MKKNKLLFPLVGMALLLGSCGAPNNGDEGNNPNGGDDVEVEAPSYKFRNLAVNVNEDFTYNLSFTTDKEVKEEVEFYLSNNSKYESKDKLIEVTKTEDNYSFTYNEENLEFYVLMVNKETKDLYGKGLYTIPTIMIDVKSNETNDVLRVLDVKNGVNLEDAVDSLSIYRSEDKTLDKTSDTLVKENVNLSNEYNLDKVVGKDYFFIEASIYGGSVLYTSNAFKLNESLLDTHLNLTSVKLTDEGSLEVKGNTKNNLSSVKLVVINNDDSMVDAVEGTLTNNNFECSYDLNNVTGMNVNYVPYLKLNANTFIEVPFNKVNSDSKKLVTTDSNIIKFVNEAETLNVILSEKGVFNVTKADMEIRDKKIYFVTEGFYDETKIDETMGTFNDKLYLVIRNDQGGFLDEMNVELTLDPATHKFQGEFDLTLIKKADTWYDIKIYCDLTKANDEEGNPTTNYQYNCVYEYRKEDATDIDKKVEIPNYRSFEYKVYSPSEVESYLKINMMSKDFSLQELTYVKVDGKVNARFSGVALNAEFVKFIVSVQSDANNKIETLATLNEDGTFVCDVDVSTILLRTEYKLEREFKLQGQENINRSEIKNDNSEIKTKPLSLISDDEGTIYYFGQGAWGDQRWWKIFRTGDVVVQNEMKVVKENDKAILKINGVGNSKALTKDTYIKLVNLNDETDVKYEKFVINNETKEFNFSFDVTDLTKDTKYQIRLVEKVGEEYLDINSSFDQSEPASFIGFYPEYLKEGFDKEVVTIGDYNYKVTPNNGEPDYTISLTIEAK